MDTKQAKKIQPNQILLTLHKYYPQFSHVYESCSFWYSECSLKKYSGLIFGIKVSCVYLMQTGYGYSRRPWNTWQLGEQALICWSCYSGWMSTDQARNPIWFDELLIWIVHPFVPHSSHSVSCCSSSSVDCSVEYSFGNYILLTIGQHVHRVTVDTLVFDGWTQARQEGQWKLIVIGIVL